MRILALGILMLAMGGCATAAEQELTRMKDTAKRAVAATDDCYSRAQAQDGYAALSSKVILQYGVVATSAQRTDISKPTPEERQSLNDLHRAWLTPCRKAMIDGSLAAMPAWRGTLVRYAEQEDVVYAGLIQGRLTWGDANTRLMVIRQETSRAAQEIASQIGQDLRRQHAVEVGRRAAAMAAMGSALVQLGQQQIEAERRRQWEAQQSRPRQLMCQNTNGWVTCTAY